jgi:hypothetical protein
MRRCRVPNTAGHQCLSTHLVTLEFAILGTRHHCMRDYKLSMWLSALIESNAHTLGIVPSTKETEKKHRHNQYKFHPSSQTLPLPWPSKEKKKRKKKRKTSPLFREKAHSHIYFSSTWFVYYCDIWIHILYKYIYFTKKIVGEKKKKKKYGMKTHQNLWQRGGRLH